MSLWRRSRAHGIDMGKTGDGQTATEEWNLICLTQPADMTIELAEELWPDFRVGTLVGNSWVVDQVRLRSIGTSEHVMATVDLVRGGKRDKDDPDPTQRPITWEMDTDYVEEAAETDADGRRLENTAFEPLLGIVDEVPVLVWTAVRYITNTPAWLQDFAKKCVNSTTVILDGFICQPETLKMEGLKLGPVEYTSVKNREIRFRQMPLRLLWKQNTWRDRYLNQGTTEYFPAVPDFLFGGILVPERRVACFDSLGKPVEKPVPLTKEGQRFREFVKKPTVQNPNAGEWIVKEKLGPKDFHFIEFQRNKKLDFNLLFT